eukprot:comp15546_c0_seq1/m.12605 comp15546_c0_seq1/g.12605  ORF comp15546_c0_seq1/g.12605 comp15546_c0_seq1/m.12605 type:complete len:173 (-) comp15546_c0_seq1:732-1250(-)
MGNRSSCCHDCCDFESEEEETHEQRENESMLGQSQAPGYGGISAGERPAGDGGGETSVRRERRWTREQYMEYQDIRLDEEELIARAQRLGLIEYIPILYWSEDLTHHPGNEECPICMEDYKVGDQVRCLPCRHVFHFTCVDDWLERSFTCPLCQAAIPLDVDQLGGISKSSI